MAVKCNNCGYQRTPLDFVVRWFYSIATCVLVCVRNCAKVLRDVGEVWKLWRYKRDFVRSFPKGVDGGAPSVLDLTEGAKGSFSTSDIYELITEDILTLNNNLQLIIGSDNPNVTSAAEHIFGSGGKRIRPTLVFLVSRATAKMVGLKDLIEGQRRLAKIIEFIHTASLIHDDIIDESDMRRGKETVHQLYGTKMALLVGDFMLARSTSLLAELENFEIIKLLGEVIGDLVNGEIKQAASLF